MSDRLVIRRWRERRAARLRQDREVVLRVLRVRDAYGLELVEAGVRASHLYVVLAKLEREGKITSCWAVGGRRSYRIAGDS